MPTVPRLRLLLPILLAGLTTVSTAFAGEVVDWDYAHGTERWGYLRPEYSPCRDGRVQTPIAVSRADAERRNLPRLQIAYATNAGGEVHNLGYTIETFPAAGSAILIGTRRYELVKFHLHVPSETFLDGEQLPLELHFVHEAADRSGAVLGVLYAQGPADAQLQKIIDAMPPDEGGRAPVSGVNLRSFIPNGASYRFRGSLTTPPCDEGFDWLVMGALRTASASQIAAFRALYSGERFPGGNRRPVQSLNSRSVETER